MSSAGAPRWARTTSSTGDQGCELLDRPASCAASATSASAPARSRRSRPTSGGAPAAARRLRQAGAAGADRPALARLSYARHRIPADEADRLPGHDHHGLGGRRRRETTSRLPPLCRARRAPASTPSCISPTSASPASRAELYHLGFAQPEAAGRTVAENADIVIGVKVRMSENIINQAGIER